VSPNGKVVGLASYNYPKFNSTYHFASFVSEIIDALTAEGVDPRQAEEIPYRNGTYRWTLVEGLPSGTWVFTFEPGHERIDETTKVWRISANFVRGNPTGQATLLGPLGDDKVPQHCEMSLDDGRVRSGSCSIYFDNIASTMGIDPDDRRWVQAGIDTGQPDPKPGKATLTGRYEGSVIGGDTSFFEPSKYLLVQRLSEEYLQPDGEGVFYVYGGSATISTVNWSLDQGTGPMIMTGSWVRGSFTGKGSIRSPNGSLIEGDFDAGYIASGTATRATGNIFGTAHGFDYDVYTGQMQGGWKNGAGELYNTFKHYSAKGEFRDDFLWNGFMISEENGKKICSIWKENTIIGERELRGSASCP
jgi:hypothetical protein